MTLMRRDWELGELFLNPDKMFVLWVIGEGLCRRLDSFQRHVSHSKQMEAIIEELEICGFLRLRPGGYSLTERGIQVISPLGPLEHRSAGRQRAAPSSDMTSDWPPPTRPGISVLIADDHEVVRTGLRNLLADSEIKIAAEVATGNEAVKYALEHDVDVVLMDIRLRDGDGLTALGRIKLDKPDLPILMLSTFDNPTYIARAVALGASGYLLKGCSRDELIAAIEKASAGETAWTRDELRRVTGALATPGLAADVEVPLTQRESEVLRQVACGLTNQEIAQSLDISYETVKEHVQHILRKIGVSDRTQAAAWAVRKQLA